MGNSSSTAASSLTAALRQPDFKQLNDNVYELYAPALEAPTLEIFFIHGPHLHGTPKDAFWRNWTTSDNECWPQTWLVKEENFPTARILAVSYDASVMESATHGRPDLLNLAEDILHGLIHSHSERCPLFLVAHSFGGLAVKQMILLADKMVHRVDHHPRIDTFLDDLAGIVFFSTPHRGMSIPRFPGQSPLMEFASSVLNTEVARLSEDFLYWRRDNPVKTLGLSESEQTRWGRYFDLVVPEASSRFDVNTFRTVEGDHFTICAPPNPATSVALRQLTLFIKQVLAQQDIRAENFQHLPQQIIGIDLAVEEVIAKLNHLEATSLGVVGKGGIGKTTLVKKVFNILARSYDYSCFVHEVKNIEDGVEAVKKAILQHVHRRGKKMKSKHGDLKSLLKGKRLLLVLDHAVSGNISSEFLLSLQDEINVDAGSRLVLTSRKPANLSVLGDLYHVPALDEHFATGLLTSLAYPESDAPASLQIYLNTIVTKCEGLPLALEVLGHYLHEKSEDSWQDAIRVLDEADDVADFNERLWAKLRVSYDALNEEEQQMFLDAATIFNGCRLSEAKEVWNLTMKEAEHERWERLVHMSLVWEVAPMGRIDGEYPDKFIGMHEQLRSMGRQIESTVGDNAKRKREKRRERLHRHSSWNLPSTPVDWDEDPITVERMCDPVKCNDGRTYDRWTIIDHPNMMSKSPFNPALKLDIVVDDISLRSLLFHKIPEQEAKFDGRRRDYREVALQNARALQSEDGKDQIQDAIKKLNNVLKWAPLDTECQNELETIRNLRVNKIPNFPMANIPVLNHRDVVRSRGTEERYIVLGFALLFICVSLYIT